MRGLNPVVIATAAVFVYGEQLALPKALGVGCVSAGIALLGWEAVKRSKTVTLRGLSFAGLSALATASGALTDSLGARAANDPLSYGPLIAIGNAAAMAAYQVRRVDLARVVAENWRIAALGSLISTASYQLLVWSVSRAPVALVVSLRETSMLFAVAIGAFVLRERVGAWRWLAVAIVFAGVLLIRA